MGHARVENAGWMMQHGERGLVSAGWIIQNGESGFIQHAGLGLKFKSSHNSATKIHSTLNTPPPPTTALSSP